MSDHIAYKGGTYCGKGGRVLDHGVRFSIAFVCGDCIRAASKLGHFAMAEFKESYDAHCPDDRPPPVQRITIQKDTPTTPDGGAREALQP